MTDKTKANVNVNVNEQAKQFILWAKEQGITRLKYSISNVIDISVEFASNHIQGSQIQEDPYPQEDPEDLLYWSS